MSTVKLLSSSGGSVEIAAPVTASNYVLTAPATSSTIDTLARTGNVLQVVNATYSTTVISSSSTYADTGLTATITPINSTSKILVFVNQSGCEKNTSDTNIALKLTRNSTYLIEFELGGGYTGSTSTNVFGACSCCYLDSPSTLSPVTYKTQFKSFSNTSQVRVQSASSTSTITLMEIAG